jgi:hypothetical protein
VAPSGSSLDPSELMSIMITIKTSHSTTLTYYSPDMLLKLGGRTRIRSSVHRFSSHFSAKAPLAGRQAASSHRVRRRMVQRPVSHAWAALYISRPEHRATPYSQKDNPNGNAHKCEHARISLTDMSSPPGQHTATAPPLPQNFAAAPMSVQHLIMSRLTCPSASSPYSCRRTAKFWFIRLAKSSAVTWSLCSSRDLHVGDRRRYHEHLGLRTVLQSRAQSRSALSCKLTHALGQNACAVACAFQRCCVTVAACQAAAVQACQQRQRRPVDAWRSWPRCAQDSVCKLHDSVDARIWCKQSLQQPIDPRTGPCPRTL